jgi:hemin uptake protein HemP
MRKIILILIYVHVVNILFAQDTQFNNTFARNTPVLSNVFCYEDGYIALGGDFGSNSKIEILILYFNEFGEQLWEKTYGDNIYHYYHGTQNSLIENSDGRYSLSGHRTNPETDYRACMLTKFDQNFDTLWTKLYFDNPDFTVFYNHIQTTDGGYALVGCTTESDADGDVLLVKTDSDGNMLWYKKYGTSEYDAGYCIVETPDNGFLIGGKCSLGNRDGYLIKTDSNGNQEWTKHYGNPIYHDGTIYTLVKTSQNEYIIPLTTYVTDPISEDFYNRKYNIIKLDTDFNEVWNKQYGIRAEYTNLATATVAENGDIWATIKDDHVAGLFHLSPNGDSISKHYYSAEGSTGSRSLLSIKQTSDNGFIMAGVAYDPQVMWLVKTDSCGCVEEDCECGGSDVRQFISNNGIEVFPNPASDLLYLQLPENSGDAIVKIYDATGRIVQSEKLANNQNSINIRGLTAGNYVLKVQFRDNCWSSGFIKN